MPGVYAVSTCVNSGLSRRELFEAIAACGFRHVELGMDPEVPHSWAHDPGAMRRHLEDAGLAAFSVHVPSTGWKCCHPDDELRRAAVEVSAACFALAVEVGAGVVVVHATSPDAPMTEADRAANRARGCDSLAELAERAAPLGVRLAAENLPARGTARPGALVGELLEMIGPLGDGVGVCLDAGHSNANGAVAADEVRAAGRKLLAVHIHDNDGRGEDLHWMPGRGTVDWPAFLAALDEVGFDSPRAFEVPSRRGETRSTLEKLA
ncbi:MAG: sugar phosphate isomerase/epimerase family protein, partial [Planctomycetota bacterium]